MKEKASQRKKILILGHNDGTQFIDIYNQYTQVFDNNQYSVTVAYLTNRGKEAVTKARTLAENVIFLNIPKEAIRGLKIKAILTLLGLCKKHKFDLVICHRYKPTYIMLWAAQFCRIPALIFVMHELGTMKSRHRQILIACLARKNMVFAGVSHAVKNDLQKNLWGSSRQSVTTLYNTINVETTERAFLSKSEARRRLNLPEDAFIFGNAARLVPNKDHATLIQAFSTIKTKHPHAKLVILGGGPLETQLKNQAESLGLSLADNVIFTGTISEASHYMKAFDCFVLTSTQEAFGRVLIEAMCAKLPIIATRVNGIPEVLGNTGLLIEPSKTEECRNALQKVIESTDAERQALGEEGYNQVVTKFSIPAFRQAFWEEEIVKAALGSATLS